MKIALVSLNQFWEDKSKNQIQVENFVKKSTILGSGLVIFPEMTLTGFSMNISRIAEDKFNSATLYWFSTLAKKYHLNIIFGYVELGESQKGLNKLIYMNKDGKIDGEYCKVHPFSYVNENDYFIPGKEIVTNQIDNAILGFSICYDLRFPEIFQVMSEKATIIVNIANWPKKRVKHWKVLLQARAIENQVFMIGVNRTGIDGNNIEYEYSSSIFSPNGDELIPEFLEKELSVYSIDPELAIKNRKEFPVKKDRKSEFYKRWLQ